MLTRPELPAGEPSNQVNEHSLLGLTVNATYGYHFGPSISYSSASHAPLPRRVATLSAPCELTTIVALATKLRAESPGSSFQPRGRRCGRNLNAARSSLAHPA
jgi:hypothetical protein